MTTTESSNTTTVHALSHDGRGIATCNHKTLFISGALPGETVRYQITKRHGQYDEAKITEILHPAPERAVPPCAHFSICGGCSLQHMQIETELALKQQTVLDQMKHIGKTEPKEVLPPLQANALHYRRKARLGVKFVQKKNKLLAGFREKAGRYLADIDACLILHEKVGSHLRELADCIQSLSIFDHIPQVEVAVGDETVALVFRHLKAVTEEDKNKLIIYGKENNVHIYLQPNSPEKISKLWPEEKIERLYYSIPEENLQYAFHPLDFTQINLAMNRLMIHEAMDWLDIQSDERVLDLFCGLGNFTLPIAKRAKTVTGVEGSLEMVERAKENAARNQILNTEFYAANLMDETLSTPWLQQKYDKILLDPPRAGAKEILQQKSLWQAEKIVYISCHPATLARDAYTLTHEAGFRLSKLRILNMFPFTSHVETIALFEKNQ